MPKAKDSALQVEQAPIERLTPYDRNPRRNEAAVGKVAASIREFGWRQPIVVDEEWVVLAGHTRLLAAQSLGLKEVPVHVARGLSAEQRRAFRIADNRTAQEAEWDTALLASEIQALLDAQYNVAATGFDADEIKALVAEASRILEGADPDEAPEPPAEPKSKPGDLYQLGRHRVLCGDSTVATDVDRLLAGATPHLMVTDPPYGVEYDADWRNHAGDLGYKQPTMGKGGRAIGKVLNDDRADWRDAYALFPGDVAYVWHAGTKGHEVAQGLIDCGFEIRAQLMWSKARFVISRGHYHPKHEPLFYAVRSGGTGHWQGARDQSTVWEVTHHKSETGHSTQKPVECMKRPIENNSQPGDEVYDPFLGSGTTLIAAEMTGRICYGMELNPAYVDVIVARWEKVTGLRAHRVEGE